MIAARQALFTRLPVYFLLTYWPFDAISRPVSKTLPVIARCPPASGQA